MSPPIHHLVFESDKYRAELGASDITNVTETPCLKEGDMIRAVTPASTESDSSALSKSISKLRELGFNVSLGDCVGKLRTWGHLSGTDRERAREFNDTFAASHIGAIFRVRGGHGTPRVLPHLDHDVMRSNSKIFLGYSDITTLHIATNQKSDLVTSLGAMIASEIGPGFIGYGEKAFLQALTKPEPLEEITNPTNGPVIKTINEGRHQGHLSAATYH